MVQVVVQQLLCPRLPRHLLRWVLPHHDPFSANPFDTLILKITPSDTFLASPLHGREVRHAGMLTMLTCDQHAL